MASPYYPEHLGEEQLHVLRLHASPHMYGKLQEHARRRHIDPPSEIVMYALALFFKISDELEQGGRLCIQRGSTTRELALPHPTRTCEPLVARPAASTSVCPVLTAQPGTEPTTQPDEAATIEVTVKFTPSAHRVAMQLANATHVTPSELFRDALSVYWWLAREHGQGHSFLVRRGDMVTEVMVPSLKDEAPPGPAPDERHAWELEEALLDVTTREDS
jgi:hypothetical protein